MRQADVVVVGGSAAGIPAAVTARMHYPEKSILLIRKEKQVLIPCGIPYIFGTVRKPEKDSFMVSINHFIDPKMLDIRIYEPPGSRSRYDTISRMLKDRTDKLNEELVKSILSDHNGLICSHRDNIKLGTL